jgi:hypothetical protein
MLISTFSFQYSNQCWDTGHLGEFCNFQEASLNILENKIPQFYCALLKLKKFISISEKIR